MKTERREVKTTGMMIDQIADANNLANKCRCRLGVLREHFDHLSDEENEIAFDDHVLWAMGIKEILTDTIKDLSEADALTFRLSDDLKLYSLDMEKVEKENKYRKSIGIDTALEVPA